MDFMKQHQAISDKIVRHGYPVNEQQRLRSLLPKNGSYTIFERDWKKFRETTSLTEEELCLVIWNLMNREWSLGNEQGKGVFQK